jgi:DNA-binding CsgD family transcriptional regulator
MIDIDPQQLDPLVAEFVKNSNLTPAERSEVVRLAKAMSCNESAQAAGVSAETIRARRKRIYRKLDVGSATDLLSEILALSLKRLVAAGSKAEAAA